MHEPPVPPRQIDRGIPRDLEVIILKALAKDPKDRFKTARDLADELRRFVDNRPIRSRPIPAYEQFWRWCKRNPVLAALNALAATLTTAIAIISTLAAIRLEPLQRRGEGPPAARRVGRVAENRAASRGAPGPGPRRPLQPPGRPAVREPGRSEKGDPPWASPRSRRLELRNEAIACLALPDVRPERELGVWDGKEIVNGTGSRSTEAFEHFAYSDREGAVTASAGSMTGRSSVVAPVRARVRYWVRLGFSPDGRWLIIQYRHTEPGRAVPVLAWEVQRGPTQAAS